MSEVCDECKKPCDGCIVGTLSDVEQMRILGNGRSGAGYELKYDVIKGLHRARQLHPQYAEGVWQGLGVVSAEVGELVRAVEKREGRERVKAEIIDCLVVLIRFWLEEYEVAPE